MGQTETKYQSGGGAEFSSSSSSPASSFSHGQLSVPIGQQHVCLFVCLLACLLVACLLHFLPLSLRLYVQKVEVGCVGVVV
jgi:hypothetical protein